MTASIPGRKNVQRILFVCDQLPSLGYSGPTKYNADILEILRAAGHEVELAITGPNFASAGLRSMETRATFAHGKTFCNFLLPVTAAAFLRYAARLLHIERRPTRKKRIRFGAYFNARQRQYVIERVSALKPDLVFFDTIYRIISKEYINPRIKLVLVAHDVFTERREAFELQGYEVAHDDPSADEYKAVSEIDGFIAINDGDARFFGNLEPRRPVVRLWPVARSFTQKSAPGAADLLYLGTKTEHNIHGLRWFFEKVWPRLRLARPDVRLHVVGDIDRVFRSAPEGVVFHGRLKTFTAVSSQCLLAINPVLVGSGLKIKMLDYASLGLPTVVTPIAALGYPDIGASPYIVAPSSEEFAAAIIKLIEDPLFRKAMVDKIDGYIAQFSTGAGAAAISHLIDALSTADLE